MTSFRMRLALHSSNLIFSWVPSLSSPKPLASAENVLPFSSMIATLSMSSPFTDRETRWRIASACFWESCWPGFISTITLAVASVRLLSSSTYRRSSPSSSCTLAPRTPSILLMTACRRS